MNSPITTAEFVCYWCDLSWAALDTSLTYNCPTPSCLRPLRERVETRATLSEEEAERRRLTEFFFGKRFHTGLRPAPANTIPRPTCYDAPKKK